MRNNELHKILSAYLKGNQSYAGIEDALKDINPSIINKKLSENTQSIWELLEHIRITQVDILNYTLDSNWVSPSWPEGHWPDKSIQASNEMMQDSVNSILSDFEKVSAMAADESLNLISRVPHGEWRTYLRQIILVIEHNAYHLGQLILLRKVFNDWK